MFSLTDSRQKGVNINFGFQPKVDKYIFINIGIVESKPRDKITKFETKNVNANLPLGPIFVTVLRSTASC